MANGRYDDRLKVYKNGTWYDAKRVRVYKNGWIDLGDDQSDNTKSLYVRKGSDYTRVTRNKNVTPREVTEYAGYQQRETTITTLQEYCFSNSGGATNREFHVIMYVKANAATRLFEFWTNPHFSFYAGIKADGSVYYTIKDNYYIKTTYTNTATHKIAMGFNQEWQKIEFLGEIAATGANAFKVKVNDQQTGFRLGTAWDAQSWGGLGKSSGKLGSSNLRIAKDSEHDFEIDTCDSPFTSLVDEKTTTTVYDTTWV